MGDNNENFTCLQGWSGADNLPGFDEEPVLDEHCDKEEDNTLYCHGKEVPSHQLPRQRRHKTIFSCQNKMKSTVTFPEQASISSCWAHQVGHQGNWRATSGRRKGIGPHKGPVVAACTFLTVAKLGFGPREFSLPKKSWSTFPKG